MREQVKMLEHHSHFLTKIVDVELYSLAGSVLVFLLGDIHTVEDDLTVCRLFQKVQASKKSGFTGT